MQPPRCTRCLRRLVARFPRARDLALGTMVGALAVAVTNAVAISVALPFPPGGWAMRLSHHLHDALAVLGLGALLALGPALAAWGARRLGCGWRAAAGGWLAMTALSVVAMHWLLALHLRREALALFDGRAEKLLFPLYLASSGVAIPVACLLAAVFAAHGRAAAIPVGLGLGGLVTGHLVLRGDYQGVHTAIGWTAATLIGVPLAARLSGRLTSRRRQVGLVLAATLCASGALAWSPPHRVRVELLREAGTAAPWVLARTVWSLPRGSAQIPESMRPRLEPPRQWPSRGPYAREPVVVLVTVEALRADALTEPASGRDLPNLAWLRDHGAYVERAVAHGSQTAVTLTTMFSGRYYSQLSWRPHGEGPLRFLYAAEDPTLRFPELLTAGGVRTTSYVGLSFLAGRFGVARGFAREHVLASGKRHAKARRLVEPLLRELERIDRGPHFFYTHLMEPHEPYDQGSLREGTDHARYLSEVAVIDRWLGRVRAVLEQRLHDRGYLIVTGDHGEAFGEHAARFHTTTLYEELVRVPLLIWGPGIPARRLVEPAGLVDVGPTVLQLFGLRVPAGQMGQSLLPLIEGRVDHLDRPLVAEGRLRRALFARSGLKVIEDTRLHVVEAYDLGRDPGELDNLFDEDPDRVGPDLALLRALFARHTRRDPPGYEPPFRE